MTVAESFDLIPAIDLRRGQVVRLAQGEDARRTVYDPDPRPVLERYLQAGVRRVHLVDLDAAFGEKPQRALLTQLLEQAGGSCALQVGGGLRDRAALDWALGTGFARVVVTSLLVKSWETCADFARQAPGVLVPALDVRRGELKMSGWTESAPIDLAELCLRLRELPLGAVLVTDIERDGMLDGPNLELAADMGRSCGVAALLSGGVRTARHLQAAADTPGIGGAIVGRALLDGALALEDAVAATTAGRPA